MYQNMGLNSSISWDEQPGSQQSKRSGRKQNKTSKGLGEARAEARGQGDITDFEQIGGLSCTGDRCAASKHGGAMQPRLRVSKPSCVESDSGCSWKHRCCTEPGWRRQVMSFQQRVRPTSCFRVWVIPYRSAGWQRTSPDSLPTARCRRARKRTKEASGSRAAWHCPTIGSERHKPSNPSPLQQAPEAKSLVRQIHYSAGQGRGRPPLNKPLREPFPGFLRAIRGGGNQAGV